MKQLWHDVDSCWETGTMQQSSGCMLGMAAYLFCLCSLGRFHSWINTDLQPVQEEDRKLDNLAVPFVRSTHATPIVP
jgi:hypothetical protein